MTGVRTWLLYLPEIFFVGTVTYFILHSGLYDKRANSEYSDVYVLIPNETAKNDFHESYLSEKEKSQYDSCFNETVSIKVAKKFGPITGGKCRFQYGKTKKYSVALGSFQGSGNTWLRGLIEKVTGICTGSRYCDGALRTRGFSGEGVYGPSVIAIKSHTVNPLFTKMENFPRRISKNIPVFGAAIVLIRNPRNAMIAEWHREKTKRLSNIKVSNHFLYVGKEYFGDNQDWNDYVVRMTVRWKRHICGWLMNGRNNPLHLVKYANLKISAKTELMRIMKFYSRIEMPVPYDLAQIDLGYNNFYRNHTDSFHHYTSEQDSYISETVQDTINILRQHYDANSPIIELLLSYL